MSNAQKEDTVKQHFKDGKLPRLELVMLPRDPQRSLGTLRKVLCSSFNYVRKYPAKLDLFIECLKFTVNMALMYRAESKMKAEEVEKLKAEALAEKEAEEARIAEEAKNKENE